MGYKNMMLQLALIVTAINFFIAAISITIRDSILPPIIFGLTYAILGLLLIIAALKINVPEK